MYYATRTMAQSKFAGIVYNVMGILVCGGIGGIAGWSLTMLTGWTGTPAALLAVAVGMVVATGAWIGLVSAVRSMRSPP